MRRLAFLAFALLAGCSRPAAQAAVVATPAKAAAPAVEPAYDLAPDVVWARYLKDYPGLAAAELVTDQSEASCAVRLGVRFSVKVCAVGNKVDRIIVMGNSRTRPGDLNAQIDTMSSLFPAHVEPRDLVRAKAEAAAALKTGRNARFYVGIAGFSFFPASRPWMLVANAALD
jgi:hypothetical protein